VLILARKVNESIVINGNIVVTVLDVRGDQVRLGIAAPKDVTVHRNEVFEAIQAANQAAAGAGTDDLKLLPSRPPRGPDGSSAKKSRFAP